MGTPPSVRTLLLDIETAPNLAFVWGLWKQNIAHDHLEASSYILCWSAKWLHAPHVTFASVQHQGSRPMLQGIHTLLNEADVVVHYNGGSFDIPILNKEFVKHHLPPPPPYKQMDLLKVCRRVFRFESNKLDAVLKYLGLGEKTKHRGFELWVGCMRGDRECWREMEKYNRNDVRVLEKLYARLLPWLPQHPHIGVMAGRLEACPSCGVEGRMQGRGVQVSRSLRYRRFQCQGCGAWSRARVAEKGGTVRYV